MGLFSKNLELKEINEKLDLILDYLTKPNHFSTKPIKKPTKENRVIKFQRTQPFVLKTMSDGKIWSTTKMQKLLVAQYPSITSKRAAVDAMKNLAKKGKIIRLAHNAYKIAR